MILWINRVTLHVTRAWDALVEYRLLYGPGPALSHGVVARGQPHHRRPPAPRRRLELRRLLRRRDHARRGSEKGFFVRAEGFYDSRRRRLLRLRRGGPDLRGHLRQVARAHLRLDGRRVDDRARHLHGRHGARLVARRAPRPARARSGARLRRLRARHRRRLRRRAVDARRRARALRVARARQRSRRRRARGLARGARLARALAADGADGHDAAVPRARRDRRRARARPHGRPLYGANTVGAALGALARRLPAPARRSASPRRCASPSRSTWSSAALAFVLRARIRATASTDAPAATTPNRVRRRHVDARVSAAASASPSSPSAACVTFALEIAYVHLLAVVAGNSAYAFALMLVRLPARRSAGGAAVARRLLRRDAALRRRHRLASSSPWPRRSSAASSCGARMPACFAGLRHDLAGRDLRRPRAGPRARLLRGAGCRPPPASARSIPSPWTPSAAPPRAARRRRRAAPPPSTPSATSPARSPAASSCCRTSARCARCTLLGRRRRPPRRRRARRRTARAARSRAGFAAVAVLLRARSRARFDLGRLASGANVYFATSDSAARSSTTPRALDGGLTTVLRSRRPRRRRATRCAPTASSRATTARRDERAVRLRHRRAPARRRPRPRAGHRLRHRHHHAPSSATPASPTSTSPSSPPTSSTSPTATSAAVNDGVLDAARRRASTSPTGATTCCSRSDRYDLIGIELTSIWFAGAASLYNREFYRARARASPRRRPAAVGAAPPHPARGHRLHPRVGARRVSHRARHPRLTGAAFDVWRRNMAANTIAHLATNLAGLVVNG